MLSVSLIVPAFALLQLAHAGDEDLLRTLEGQLVRADHRQTVLLFFSMGDPDSVRELELLAQRHAAGEAVVAVSTDRPELRTLIRPYLKRHGFGDLPIAHDPVATLCERLQVAPGEAVIVRHDHALRVLWRGDSPADAPNAEPTDEVEAPALAAYW